MEFDMEDVHSILDYYILKDDIFSATDRLKAGTTVKVMTSELLNHFDVVGPNNVIIRMVADRKVQKKEYPLADGRI